VDNQFKPSPELAAEIDALGLQVQTWGRMIAATAAGDDAAYERARRDFWGLSDADIPSTPTPSVLEDTGRAGGDSPARP
jgi:hypothetical protein